MNIQIEEVDGKLICMKDGHNEPISMVIMEDSIPLKDRLLCASCFKLNSAVGRIIPLKEVQDIINDKLGSQEKKEIRQNIYSFLKSFSQKMKSILTQINNFVDETLKITEQWMKETIHEDNQLTHLIKGLEVLNKQELYEDANLIMNESYCNKLSYIFTSQIEEFKNSYEILKSSLQQQSYLLRNINQNVNQIQLINSVQQEQKCWDIAFNMDQSIMAAGCGQDIKLWKFDQGQITEWKKLSGHHGDVTCIVFSKKINWLVSSSLGSTITCWKECNGDWIMNKMLSKHTGSITCLILNKNEDELIASSGEQTIKVWKVNCNTNKLVYSYSLEKRHSCWIRSIMLNESETYLVSCGDDKKIVLWKRQYENRWYCQHEIYNDDFGNRICFISELMITWQQLGQGTTHLFEIVNEKLIMRANIELDQELSDHTYFPTIYNKKRQIIVQNHNKYVYLLRIQENGSLKLIADPIDCLHLQNFGTLTDDGEYLVVYNLESKEFRVHKIMYQSK